MTSHFPSFEEEPRITTDRIIEAAMRVFARGPADTVSLRSIASEAGVKLPLIMYHFKSKDNLYQIVFDHVSSLHEALIHPYRVMLKENETLTREQAAGILSMLINSAMDCLYDDSPGPSGSERIWMIEMLFPTKFHDRFYEKHFKKRYELWMAIVMAVTGGTDRETAAMQATMICGQMFGFRFTREVLTRFSGLKGFSREETECMKAIVLRNTFLMLESDLADKYFGEAMFPGITKTGRAAAKTGNVEDYSESDFHEPDDSIASVAHIIDAATRLFSRQNVDTVSLSHVAKEADVKVPLLVYHFKNKANLYRIVVERTIAAWQDRVRDCENAVSGTAKTEAGEQVRRLISQIMQMFYDRNPTPGHRGNMLVYEALYPSKYYETFYEKYYLRHFESLVAAIESVVGPKSPLWTHLQAAALFGLLLSFRLERETLVRSIGLAGFTKEETEMLESTVVRSVFLILGAPLVLSPQGSGGLTPRLDIPEPGKGGTLREK